MATVIQIYPSPNSTAIKAFIIIKDQGSGLALNFPKAIQIDIPFSLSSSEEEPDYASSFNLDNDEGENTSSKGEVKQFEFVGE